MFTDAAARADEELLIALANTDHEGPDDLADPASARTWWAGLPGLDRLPAAGVAPAERAALERLRGLRLLIRQAAWANNGVDAGPVAEAPLAGFGLHAEVVGSRISLRAAEAGASIDVIGATAIGAWIRASARREWPRLKACRARDCGWVFVDTSRNASRRWCDMGDCGNRAKGAAFRARAKAGHQQD